MSRARQFGALQAASIHGHFETNKFLLDKGADVNIQGGCYGSALQEASRKGHLKIIKFLLDKGRIIVPKFCTT